MKLLDAPPSGEELKEIRLAYKLTKKEMGEVLGVAAPTINSYETGKTRIPYKHLKRINRLLATPVPSALRTRDELRFLRTSRGLTQRQVDAFGVSCSAIAAYEKGLAPIPAGLAECIRGLAEPKDKPASSDEPSGFCALPDVLQQIAQSRQKEREYWLQLGRAITPTELRQLRQSRGLSEYNLAEGIGIPRITLHCYETGSMRIPKGFSERIIELFPFRTITPAELRQLRGTEKISQTRLSKALNFKSNALRPYEAGKRKLPYEISRNIMEFFLQRAEEMRSDGEPVKK